MNKPTPGFVWWGLGRRKRTRVHITDDTRRTLCGRRVPGRIAKWGRRRYGRVCKRCAKTYARQLEQIVADDIEEVIGPRPPLLIRVTNARLSKETRDRIADFIETEIKGGTP